ncbi:MAG: lytic transglycosylase domain-containing protein [Firmicutes bacterium]|nr:lytic transglycosylase domain-containing protein [Bacillota bacterium]
MREFCRRFGVIPLAIGVASATLIVSLVVLRVTYPLGYSGAVEKYSAEFSIERSLLYAVIKAESGFMPRARSSSGALGLMQVMPRTGSWVASQLGIPFSEEALFDPEKNIRIGSYYMRHLLDLFGEDVTAALAAYNCGLGNVLEWTQPGRSNGGSPTPGPRRFLWPEDIQFPETRRFIERVRLYRRIYRVIYPLYFR